MSVHLHVNVVRPHSGCDQFKVHYRGLTAAHTDRTALYTDFAEEAEIFADQLERERQLHVFTADIVDRSIWAERFPGLREQVGFARKAG